METLQELKSEPDQRLEQKLDLMLLRLDKLEQRKGAWGTIGSFLYEHRQFIVGIIVGLLIAFTFPFAERGTSIITLFPNQTVSVTKDTPKKIAQSAPKDSTKRQRLTQAYRSTAKAIQEQELTEMDDVISTLRQETISVLSNPEWKETNNRIEKLLLSESDLKSLGDKLNELADLFSN
jgi:hypothetical protein